MRENIIRIYWQAMDSDGQVVLYHTEKPVSNGVNFGNRGQYDCYILFPITLKPLQIAKITVNENGTWSYEIEREEGWYMARHDEGAHYVLLYKNGDFWISLDLNMAYSGDQINHYTISSTRIPDECII